MSNQPKLRGAKGMVPALTRLKELCLKEAEVRDELWQWRNEPELTNAAIRGRIEARWGIELKHDGKLSQFWGWLRQVRRQENYNERVEQFEDWYRKMDPSATVERVREAGIAFFLTEAAAEEDRAGFVEVANLDLKQRGMESKAAFEERKVQVAERRMKLLEQKAAQADQAKAVVNSRLSAEEKQRKMKEIFGLG